MRVDEELHRRNIGADRPLLCAVGIRRVRDGNEEPEEGEVPDEVLASDLKGGK